MVGNYIEFEKKRWLGIIKLNNPPVNSLGIRLLEQLDNELKQIELDEGIRVVIITGVGKCFAAGGDIQELEKINGSFEGVQLSNQIHSFFSGVETFPKPIIAAINGPCLGGGLELALACHVRVAQEEALFGFPEINLALIPGGGGTQRLPRAVGKGKAYEMILIGEAVDAREAHRIGLVNVVSPKGEVMAYAEGFAEKISQKAYPAVLAAVKAIQASTRDDGQAGMKKEAEVFGDLFETVEKKEGIKAFLEKRPPNF